jgi:hypothetical protein
VIEKAARSYRERFGGRRRTRTGILTMTIELSTEDIKVPSSSTQSSRNIWRFAPTSI